LDRKENSRFYPPGHPQHMTSIFDPYKVTKIEKDGFLYVRVTKRQPGDFKIIIEEIEV
jgi:hypothetical protein